MTRQHLINIYLDYVNNWLTIVRWAEFHELEEKDAKEILDMGKKYHEEYVAILKGA